MTNHNWFHEGELAVQAQANKTDNANRNVHAIRSQIPEGAMQFVEQQPMAVIGSMDLNGLVWASAIFGQPGFLHAINHQLLEIDLRKAGFSVHDPLWKNINLSADIGLLLIELVSRHRLRINGRVHKVSHEYYLLEVAQVYPNCPKYIQRRRIKKIRQLPGAGIEMNENGTRLTSVHKMLIEHADTFFVASAHPQYGLDASHRGGRPGFVQVHSDRLLRIPDYPGNNMFNTLGNFQVYPFAGLAFIDFRRNVLLQLSGRVKILWNIEEPEAASGGTQRYWEFDISSWQQSNIPFDIDWEFLDYSPFNP